MRKIYRISDNIFYTGSDYFPGRGNNNYEPGKFPWWDQEYKRLPEVPQGPYYHGTNVPNLTHVLPPSKLKGDKNYNESHSDYSYATTQLDDAWDHAMNAAAGNREKGGPGIPHVYQVHPLGGHEDMEEDPDYDENGNYRDPEYHDLRSSQGFKVLQELKPPSNLRILPNENRAEWVFPDDEPK